MARKRRKRKPPIGQILKARRLERGETQTEVADAAGEDITQVDVHRLETGKGITVAKACRVARALDLERDDLID